MNGQGAERSWVVPRLVPRKSREVVVRDPEHTEMRIADDGEAKAFAKQLIRGGKNFSAELNEDGSWTFLVVEINHPTKWEYA